MQILFQLQRLLPDSRNPAAAARKSLPPVRISQLDDFTVQNSKAGVLKKTPENV